MMHLKALIIFLFLESSSCLFLNNKSNFNSRDDTDNTTDCGGFPSIAPCGTSFPPSFCCPSTSVCKPLGSGSDFSIGVICCPKAYDCESLQPVSCDLTQYSATQHPPNQIHIEFNTSSAALPTCGGKCCPANYRCSNGLCLQGDAVPPVSSGALQASSTIAVSGTAPVSSAISSATTITTPSPAQASASISPAPSKKSGADTKTIALVTAIGTLALVFIITATYLLIRQTKRRNRPTSWGKPELDSTERDVRALAVHLNSTSHPSEMSGGGKRDTIHELKDSQVAVNTIYELKGSDAVVHELPIGRMSLPEMK